jgi:hypothetical protein
LKVIWELEWGVFWKKAEGECDFIAADVLAAILLIFEVAKAFGIVAADSYLIDLIFNCPQGLLSLPCSTHAGIAGLC